jgi:2-amino-4-hydroxy-6-hydroxymethyldihydropteridine diphosphokinase
MNKAYLLLGTNVGDRFMNLESAASQLGKRVGNVLLQSSIYATAPWGKTDQADFLNQVLLVETTLGPEKLMQEILSIEKDMGRIRTERNAPRIIDIDILFFNDEIINKPDLHIPHKEMHNRRFVLIPLLEIAPDLIHPGLNQSLKTLLADCKDNLSVTYYK